MINSGMRFYDYFTFGTDNEYGMPRLGTIPSGQIKMNINIASQSIQDNINYKDSQYIGLTFQEVDDSYVIQYGEEKLKVLYVNSIGRMKQVFMSAL